MAGGGCTVVRLGVLELALKGIPAPNAWLVHRSGKCHDGRQNWTAHHFDTAVHHLDIARRALRVIWAVTDIYSEAVWDRHRPYQLGAGLVVGHSQSQLRSSD